MTLRSTLLAIIIALLAAFATPSDGLTRPIAGVVGIVLTTAAMIVTARHRARKTTASTTVSDVTPAQSTSSLTL